MQKKAGILIVVFIIVGMFSCSKPGSQENAESDDNAPGDVSATAEDRGIPVEALVVKSEIVEQTFPFSGVLEPLHSVDLVSEVSGKVQHIYKQLGDPVTVKDTLALIDDRIPLSQFRQAQSAVISAENNLDIARLNLKSDRELLENGDISQLAFDNSQLAMKTAEANRLSAMASFSLAEKGYKDTRITSPIDGFISRKYIDIGAMATPGSPLYRVVDLSSLKINVGVPQSVIDNVRTGSGAEITIPALRDQSFNGQVSYISPQADESTGTFTAEVRVKNTADYLLRAGMTSKIDLKLSSYGKRIAVPDHAVVSKDGSQYVYKIHKDLAQLTAISVAEAFGSKVLIDDGVAEGDTLVTVGMKNLGVDTKVFVETLHHDAR